MVVYNFDGAVGEYRQGPRSDLENVSQMSFTDSEEETWDEVLPLNSIHPSRNNNIHVLEWVLHKAKEIQHCVGTICDGFEDRSIALLTAIEAGQTNSKN